MITIHMCVGENIRKKYADSELYYRLESSFCADLGDFKSL